MSAERLLALKRLGYAGKGDITVISDGEECLKRLKSVLPQPAKHTVDWCRVDVNGESQQSCKIKAWPLTLIVPV
jgi:hypothetical protein